METPAESSTTVQSPTSEPGSPTADKNGPMLPETIMIIIVSTGGAVLLAFIVTTVILIRKYRQSRRDSAALHRREPGGRTISGASYTDAPLRGATCEVSNAAMAGVERRYIELHPTVQPCPEPRLQLPEMSVPSSTASPSGHLPGGRAPAPSVSSCSTSSQPSGTKGSHPLVALKPRREQPLARQRSQNDSCSFPIPRPRPQQANGSLLPRPSIRQGKPLQEGETRPLTGDDLLSELPDNGRGGKRVRKRKSNGDGYDYEAGSDDAVSDSSEDESQGGTSRTFGYVDMANVAQVALLTASAVPLRQSTSAPEAATGVPEGMAAHRGASFPSTTAAVHIANRQPAVVDDDDGDCYEVRDSVAAPSGGRREVDGECSTDDEHCYYNYHDEQGTCAGPELHALDATAGGNHDDNEMRYSNLEDQHLPLCGSRGSLRSTESSAGGDSNDYYNVAENAYNSYVNVPPISFWASAANASAAAAALSAADAATDTVGSPSH